MVYDALAPVYETAASRIFYQGIARRLCERVDGTPERILDLGCGTGLSTEVLRERFPNSEVMAVDGSQAMLAIAQRKDLPDVSYTCARAEDLPFAGGSFDLVFSNVAYHWFAPEAAAEMRRVLAPSGRLALSVARRGRFTLARGNRWLARHLIGLPPARTAGFDEEGIRLEWPASTLEAIEVEERFESGVALWEALSSRGAVTALFGHPSSALEREARALEGPLGFTWPLWLVIR